MKSDCPGYDVAPYEKRVAEFKAKRTQAMAEGKSADNDQAILDKADMLLSSVNDNTFRLYNEIADAQAFYNKCKDCDYLNFKKKLEDAMARNPEIKEKAEKEPYGAAVSLKKGYQAFLNNAKDIIIPEVNQKIEGAYSEKAAKHLKEALNKAEAAFITSNGLLLIAPDNVDFLTLQKDAKAAMDAVKKDLGGTVYTSAFHGENVGKIVFSKSPVVIKSENPAAMTNTFVAGDYIYCAAYLSDKINTLAYNSDVSIEITVDNVRKYSRKFSLYYKKDLTAFDFEIVPDPTTSEQKGCIEYTRELSTLSPRNHKIIIKLQGNSSESLAVGEFSLDCSQGMDKLTTIAQDLRKKQLSKVFLPAGGALNTAALQQQAIKLWAGDETPLRAVITSNEWTIHRNALTSIIEYRDAWTALAVKKTDGTCSIFYWAVRQDYTGSGYGTTKFGAMGDSEEIPCENVKK